MSARLGVVQVWLVLVVATLVAAVLGGHAQAGASGTQIGTVVALTIAFAKAGLIGSEFMELRRAPWSLVAVFTAWVVVVWVVLVALYLGG